MRLHHLLQASAAATPEAPLLIEKDRVVSYGAIDRMANQCAHALRRCGLSAGDRVLIALDNSAEMVAAYFGAMKAGGVAVPLPAGPRSDRLPAALGDCAPKVVVVDEMTARALGPRGTFAEVPHVLALASSPWQNLSPTSPRPWPTAVTPRWKTAERTPILRPSSTPRARQASRVA